MGWKQRTTSFPGIDDGIQERFESVFMAQGAPENAALFCRTSSDFEHEIYLLSPEAAIYADIIGGEWTDCDPSSHHWVICVAAGDVATNLGIKIGGDT